MQYNGTYNTVAPDEAEELLGLGTPALLALVGQRRIDQPGVVPPAVVAHLRRAPDADRRGRLLTVMLALLPEEEMRAMVERRLEHEALLLETPSLRRIREAGREEGREEGTELASLPLHPAPLPEREEIASTLEVHKLQ